MRKVVKLIFVNLLVFLIFLMSLNVVAIALYKAEGMREHATASDAKKHVDYRSQLPNYEDIPWAKKHWTEFPGLPTEYRSYIGWRRLPFDGETINIDKEGVRITPQHPEVADSSPLVLFMGGSTMWGTGVDDKSTIPAIFASISEGKYRVLNLGESAYCAMQSYCMLLIEIMKGRRPEVVVTYDGVNEKDALYREFGIYSHRRENQIREKMRGADREKTDKNISLSSYLFGPLETYIEHKKSQGNTKSQVQKQLKNFDLSDERVTAVARRLLNTWIAMQELCDGIGAKFIAVLQPNAATGSPRLDHLNLPADQLATLEAYRKLYPEIQRLLDSNEYASLRPYVVVATEAYNNSDYIYVDYAHVSPNGNRIMADIIKQAVEK